MSLAGAYAQTHYMPDISDPSGESGLGLSSAPSVAQQHAQPGHLPQQYQQHTQLNHPQQAFQQGQQLQTFQNLHHLPPLAQPQIQNYEHHNYQQHAQMSTAGFSGSGGQFTGYGTSAGSSNTIYGATPSFVGTPLPPMPQQWVTTGFAQSKPEPSHDNSIIAALYSSAGTRRTKTQCAIDVQNARDLLDEARDLGYQKLMVQLLETLVTPIGDASTPQEELYNIITQLRPVAMFIQSPEVQSKATRQAAAAERLSLDAIHSAKRAPPPPPTGDELPHAARSCAHIPEPIHAAADVRDPQDEEQLKRRERLCQLREWHEEEHDGPAGKSSSGKPRPCDDIRQRRFDSRIEDNLVEEQKTTYKEIIKMLTPLAEKMGKSAQELLCRMAATSGEGVLPLWNLFQRFYHCDADYGPRRAYDAKFESADCATAFAKFKKIHEESPNLMRDILRDFYFTFPNGKELASETDRHRLFWSFVDYVDTSLGILSGIHDIDGALFITGSDPGRDDLGDLVTAAGSNRALSYFRKNAGPMHLILGRFSTHCWAGVYQEEMSAFTWANREAVDLQLDGNVRLPDISNKNLWPVWTANRTLMKTAIKETFLAVFNHVSPLILPDGDQMPWKKIIPLLARHGLCIVGWSWQFPLPGTSLPGDRGFDLADVHEIRALYDWCRRRPFPITVAMATHVGRSTGKEFCSPITGAPAEFVVLETTPIGVDGPPQWQGKSIIMYNNGVRDGPDDFLVRNWVHGHAARLGHSSAPAYGGVETTSGKTKKAKSKRVASDMKTGTDTTSTKPGRSKTTKQTSAPTSKRSASRNAGKTAIHHTDTEGRAQIKKRKADSESDLPSTDQDNESDLEDDATNKDDEIEEDEEDEITVMPVSKGKQRADGTKRPTNTTLDLANSDRDNGQIRAKSSRQDVARLDVLNLQGLDDAMLAEELAIMLDDPDANDDAPATGVKATTGDTKIQRVANRSRASVSQGTLHGDDDEDAHMEGGAPAGSKAQSAAPTLSAKDEEADDDTDADEDDQENQQESTSMKGGRGGSRRRVSAAKLAVEQIKKTDNSRLLRTRKAGVASGGQNDTMAAPSEHKKRGRGSDAPESEDVIAGGQGRPSKRHAGQDNLPWHKQLQAICGSSGKPTRKKMKEDAGGTTGRPTLPTDLSVDHGAEVIAFLNEVHGLKSLSAEQIEVVKAMKAVWHKDIDLVEPFQSLFTRYA